MDKTLQGIISPPQNEPKRCRRRSIPDPKPTSRAPTELITGYRLHLLSRSRLDVPSGVWPTHRLVLLSGTAMTVSRQLQPLDRYLQEIKRIPQLEELADELEIDVEKVREACASDQGGGAM